MSRNWWRAGLAGAATLLLVSAVSAQPAAGAPVAPPSAAPTARPEVESAVSDYVKEKGGESPYFVSLDEIVVTADGGVPLTYAGGRDVITSGTMAEYPAQNPQEVMRRVPGVYVIPEAGNDGRVNIGLRGNDPRRSGQVSLLIDGIPSTEASYGQQDQDALPISMERVSRIDVIRGGASIRYGPNSAGGVVNFITEPIPMAPTARSLLRFGSYSDYAALASYGGTFGDFGTLLTIVEKGGRGYRENSDYDIDDFSGKFSYRASERDLLTLSVSKYLEDAEMPGGLTQSEYRRNPHQSLRPDGRMEADQWTWSGGFTREVDPRTTFGILVWYKTLDRVLTDVRPVLAPYTKHRVQDTQSDAGAFEVRYACPVDLSFVSTDLFVSGRYYIEEVLDWFYGQPFGGAREYPSILNIRAHGRSAAAFVEDTVHLSDTVDLAVGGRLEDLNMESRSRDTGDTRDESYQLYLPEASLTWRFLPATACYASFMRSFGPPQYETGFDPASTLYADVEPEYADLYEVGLRTAEPRGFAGSIAVFYTRFEDRLQYVNMSDGNKHAFNTGKETHQGVELSGEQQLVALADWLEGFSAYGTFTWIDATIENGEFEGNRSPGAPERLASWGLRYEHRTGLFARIGGSYSGSAYKDQANTSKGSADGVNGPLPAVTLWDAAVGYRENPDGSGFSAAVGMTNIFDYEYYRRFSTGIYPGAPRQVFVTVGYGLSW